MKLKLTDGRYELLDAANQPLPDAKLSLSNCHAIALGFDLEETAYKIASYEYISSEEISIATDMFIQGFQKALEYFRYTEDDIVNIMNRVWNWCEYGTDEDCSFITELKNKHIQSLNEWNVYIEQEPHSDFVDDGNTHIISARPKLDATGCLILKRI